MSSLMLLSLQVGPAHACAVCGGEGANSQAYIDTMIFMSALPLLMLGGTAFFLWWRAQQQAAEPPSGGLPYT
jgi:glucose-6-phosphate dehydrogenase assembly protein OpcA